MSDPDYSPEEFENTIFQTVATTKATETTGSGGLATTVFPTYVPPEEGGGEAPAVSFEGRRFRQYRLKKQLGEGGQGVVWLAQDELLEKPVALKFLPLAISANQDAMERMKQEAQVLLELTHERIVRLNTLETEGDAAFLVMEYLSGPDLSDIVEERLEAGERGLSVEEALWVLDQLAEPLDYANGKGITHRDIKPANVMLTEDVDGPLNESSATAKLCDFGIAFVTTKSMHELTNYVPVGTLAFIAPEVLMGRKPTPAADIYSMAASLYYMVAGKPVFPAQNIVGHIGNSTPKPLESGDDVFDAAIARALSKDPEERPATAMELLREASGGRLGNTGTVVIKRSLRAIVATAAIVAVLAGAVYGLRNIFGTSVEIEMADATSADVEQVRINTNRDSEATFLYSFDEQGEGKYQTVLTDAAGDRDLQVSLAELGDGEHILYVRDEDGKSLESHKFTIDRTAPDPRVASLGATPYRDPGPVHDADRPVTAVFEFDEDAQLFLAGKEDDPLTTDFTKTPGEITLPAPPNPRADVREWTYHVRARDRLGTVRPVDLTVRYFSLERLVTKLRAGYPLEQLGGWDSRSWDALYADCSEWREAVETHPRLSREARRGLLEDATFEERFVELERLRAGRPSVASVEGAVAMEDGDLVIYTSDTGLRLSGRIESPRSDVVTLAGDRQGEVGVEADGTFVFRLTLERNRVHDLELTHAHFLEPQVVRVVHDDEKPAIRLPGGLAEWDVAEDPFEIAIEMREANPGTATVGEVALQRRGPGAEAGWTIWAAAGVTLDGEKRGELEVEASDLAGNVRRTALPVVLDDAPPARVAVFPREGEKRETRPGFSVRMEFDEPAEVRAVDAVFRRDGREQPVDVAPADATDSTWAGMLAPPDEDGELVVSYEVRDRLGNVGTAEMSWPVVRSPWGDVPEPERAGMSVVGDESVVDGARRFPRRIRHEKTGIEFVYVPGGSFQLGAAPHENEARENEKPPREVAMTGFYVARTETSWDQWRRGGGQGGAEEPALPATMKRGIAIAWCDQFGFVLPSEAEWEYAASGSANSKYPWGPEWSDELVNFNDGLSMGTPPLEPVDSREEGHSWCGALNMAGNVWEWCRDSLGDERLAPSSTKNPEGSLTGAVLRGGSSAARRDRCRTSFRFTLDENRRSDYDRGGLRPVWRPSVLR